MSQNIDPSSNPSAFEQLLKSAKQLNKASDQVNAELANVEKLLVGAKIGLTFWLDASPLQESDATGDLGERSHTAAILGFDRVDGHWMLAVKTLRYVSGYYQGDISSPFTSVFVENEPSALVKAPRELRLAALRVIPKFIEEFKDKVADHVAEIEAATGKLFI
jgi:hypothetical protein